jgi:AraC family ethanolamine operon transcriptional activator
MVELAPAVEPGFDGPVSMLIDAPEPEAMEEAVDGVPLQIDRLAAGPGGAQLSFLGLGGVSIGTGRTSVAIRSSGEVGSDIVLVGMPLSAGVGRWNGVELDSSRAWVYRPGAEHEGIATHTPWWAAITIERSEFTGPVRSALFGGPAVSMNESPEAARLGDLVRLSYSQMSGPISWAKAALMRDEMIDGVASIVDGGDPVSLSASTASRIVGQCEALAHELGPVPRIGQLAEQLDVSDRWIRAAFTDHYGVAPSDYFRGRAMSGCRRELVAAAPGTVTVTDMAMRWGFWHLGRFSSSYRAYFGESPSTTLARSPER